MSDLIQLRKTLFTEHHRALVILSGDSDWQSQQIDSLYKNHETVFWVASTLSKNEVKEPVCIPDVFTRHDFECIESKRLPYYLGQEISGAIIDVKQGLSADTLGIVSGMIQSGGLLILLTPSINEWSELHNPENSRFLNTPLNLSDAKNAFTKHLILSWKESNIVWLEQDVSQAASNFTHSNDNTFSHQTLPTEDQTHALKAIHSVAFGHRKRPLIITADRGRGKSSALGIAAVDCLLDGKQHIVITASRLDQTKAAFKHAIEVLKTLNTQDKSLQIELINNKPGLVAFKYNNELKTIEFIAPDHLILNPTAADILLVDEAAHLPTPLLTDLLMRHHRLVFSTTQQGYEGSGRGFELRFKKQLDIHTPDWKTCHLKQPIRWAKNDPLEHAINHALLLDANFADIDESEIFDTITPLDLSFKKVDINELLNNRAMLESLFGLLVQAHYQTSPNDLQQLLNAPNIHVLVACIEQAGKMHIIGAVLCIEEGKLNPGQARAHGHLVPQLLTKNYAQDDFMLLSTWRIMRIAVHPAYQRNGIGQHLLQEVEKLATLASVDYLSSSFGATEELLPFWFEQHFWPLHVGVKRDKASGSHNLVVAKPLTAMARQALALIQSHFQEQFPHLLLESLPYLPATQVWQIINTFRFKKRNIGLDKVLINYQNNSRPYESISGKIWEWSLQSAHTIRGASISEQAIWCDKVLKKESWQTVAHQHHLSGRKGVEEALKKMIAHWVPKKITNHQNPKFGKPTKHF
ncbi:tRNA(Met) cytidine acetyltransferase TmcA [Thiomicrorhabdus lithotrophica]|uniref:tRNA(Met) cytidine acetyltransferase TmcA n=1 Tax=Thiomicrorhabdus lithotrophica TaxID=2949997 RepID=A0ABY8CEH1_9GAMM|nr:GNAT family N-acetyltransferase [Thiomicrorhabdus lithotrophica]WEJ62803.1 GNAT family N-acetyltransferase [Thiomicrorhabdus lithotrophica]